MKTETTTTNTRRVERLAKLIATVGDDDPERVARLHAKLASLLTVETLHANPSAFLGDGREVRANLAFNDAPEGMPTEIAIGYTELLMLLEPTARKANYRPPNEIVWSNDEAVLIACPTRAQPLAVCLLDRVDAEGLNESGFLSALWFQHKKKPEQKQFLVSDGRGAALQVEHLLSFWKHHATSKKAGYSEYDLRSVAHEHVITTHSFKNHRRLKL